MDILVRNGTIDINLNAYDYFDTVLLNMIFGFVSHTASDLMDNPLPAYPKSVHTLASISNGTGTIGSLVPFIKNASITSDLIEAATLECQNALLEIQQNGDIVGFDIQIERQNHELIFAFTLDIVKDTLFYNYVYNTTNGNLVRID